MNKNIILIFIACSLWASAFPVIKNALSIMPPFLLAGMRFIIAGLLLLPFVFMQSNFFHKIRINLKNIIIISIVQTFFSYSFYFVGMKYISGAAGAIVIGSAPVIVGILSHFAKMDDRLTFRKFIALLVSFSGIIMIAISEKNGKFGLFGILLLLGGIISSGIGNILIFKKAKNLNSIILSSIQLLFGGMMLFIVSFFTETNTISINKLLLLKILYLSFISACGVSIWFYLLKRMKVSQLNLWKFIIPVLGSIFSWIFLDETPNIFAISGMLLVVGAILFYYKKNHLYTSSNCKP